MTIFVIALILNIKVFDIFRENFQQKINFKKINFLPCTLSIVNLQNK